jgi:protein SCO1/2
MVRCCRYLLGVCLVFALAACTPAKPTFKGTDVTGIGWGGDLTLQAHTGNRVSTGDFQGKLVIVFFGFSHCPDICSPTLAKLAGLRKALGPEADRVQVVFVTVDPARDTVEQLAGFLPKFDPTFVGLTGSPEEIADAAREYKVAYTSPSDTGHGHHAMIGHSGTMFVKDKTGKLRLLWNNDVSVADMEHDLRLLLKVSG